MSRNYQRAQFNALHPGHKPGGLRQRWIEVLFLSTLCISFSCGRNKINRSLFFEDFSFRCYCGIKEINSTDTEKLKTSGHRFYELFYRDNYLDSMVVFHPWNNHVPITLKCHHKDSVTVFEAVYSALGTIIGNKTYFYYDNHTFDVYQYLGEKGWLVHKIANKRSSRGLAIILKSGTEPYWDKGNNLDTAGFINKLFQHEKFKIFTAPLTDTALKITIMRNFTFNTWFDHDGL